MAKLCTCANHLECDKLSRHGHILQLAILCPKSQARKLNREDVMNHSRWMKQIRMIDDQDRCEWVNVSLVLVHLGNAGQRAIKQL